MYPTAPARVDLRPFTLLLAAARSIVNSIRKMQRDKDHGGIWTILGILALIWGSSFILMKRGLFHDGVPVLT